MNRIIKTFILYFIFWFLFSVLLKLTLTDNIQPIIHTDAYRIFGIIPLREALFFPPISLISWYYISKKVSHEKIQIYHMLFESIVALFITGIIVHKIFGVRTKLGSILHLTKEPNGTGLAPYSNY